MVNNYAKRGQMEIFGLAIVVILLVLGMMFMLFFITPTGNEDSVQVYIDDQMSQNLINSVLRVTTTCNNQEMDNLVQDCAICGNFEDGTGTINCGTEEDPKYSCDFVKAAFQEIFDSTLKEWNKDYYFKMYKDPDNTLFDINNKCPNEQIPGFGYIPLHPGTLTVQLNICS